MAAAPNPHNSSTDPTVAGLVLRVSRWAWTWQGEWAVAATVAITRWETARDFGQAAGAECLLAGTGLVLGISPIRRYLSAQMARRARRRQWENALAWLWPAPTTPRIHRCGRTAVGEWTRVRVGPGGTISDLTKQSEAIAAWLGALDVRVVADPATAAMATVHALRTDPLAAPTPPWPGRTVERTSLWWPIPVGLDENGGQVTVGLFEHNLLLGGEPGSGKSVALSQLVAAAALDPTCQLWLLDGKLVELAAWRNSATGTAGVDIREAIDVLHQVRATMDDRYQALLERRQRKVPVGTGLHVVVVDELAHYTGWPDKKPRDEFTEALRDLVARGRAAGIVVLAATQKPSADVIPTSLRDLFGYRWALRCTTPAASDTILGGGWASNGVTASSIAPTNRGVGWLLHESGVPLRLRAHHLDDETVDRIALRAASLRKQTQP